MSSVKTKDILFEGPTLSRILRVEARLMLKVMGTGDLVTAEGRAPSL